MSTTDKTRQQLVASIRKTRVAAAGKTATTGKAPRPVNRTAKSTKKTAASPRHVRTQSLRLHPGYPFP